MPILRFLFLVFAALFIFRRARKLFAAAFKSSDRVRFEKSDDRTRNEKWEEKTQQDISDADFKEIP